MKKIVLAFALMFIGAVISVQAQVEKGNWFLSGSTDLGLSSTKEKWNSNTVTVDTYKCTDFYLRPDIGYFVINKLPVGLSLAFSSNTCKDSDDDDKDTYTSFVVGPFVRYYILDAKGFLPYAQAMVGFGSSKYTYSTIEGGEDEDQASLMTYIIGVGGTYFITDNVGLDLFLGYQNQTETYKAEGDDPDDDKYITGGIKFTIGFVLSL